MAAASERGSSDWSTPDGERDRVAGYYANRNKEHGVVQSVARCGDVGASIPELGGGPEPEDWGPFRAAVGNHGARRDDRARRCGSRPRGGEATRGAGQCARFYHPARVRGAYKHGSQPRGGKSARTGGGTTRLALTTRFQK